MKTVSMGLGQALLHSHLKISIRLFPKCELLGSDEVRQGGACQRGFRAQFPSNSGFIQDLAILKKNLVRSDRQSLLVAPSLGAI